MNYEEDMKKLDGMKAYIASASKKLAEHKEYLCKQYSPVQVGDEVIVNGFSHKGKKMLVTYVYLKCHWSSREKFTAEGKVLKKDGTAGSQTAEWRDEDK